MTPTTPRSLLLRILPFRLPQGLRLAGYGSAVAVLLFLTLAPSADLPKENIWDKAEHAVAWFVLAAAGLSFWPRRPGRIAGFAMALGALVEVLQSVMPFGRDGDARDLFADGVGVGAALLAWVVISALGRRFYPQAATASPSGMT